MSLLRGWVSRYSVATRRLILLVVGFPTLVAALWLIPTPYYVTAPGAAIDTSRLISVSRGERHEGRLFMLIVATQPANLFWYLYALADHRAILETREAFLGGIEDYQGYVEMTRKMMENSRKSAQAIALQTMGYGRGIQPVGVRVMGYSAPSFARAHLERGDLLTAVAGVPVNQVTDLRAALATVRPGDSVAVSLRRADRSLELLVPTGAHPERKGAASFGILVEDELNFDLPVPIEMEIGSITGPSAGLMFSLQIIDQLTPQGITSDLVVAGTGTIERDGRVGRIGGVQQKVYTAEAAGADVMFVPVENYEEARQVASRIRLVPVEHLRDAISWLREQKEHKKQNKA